MVEDVRLAVKHNVPVEHFGRTGGIIHTPEEILEALEQKIIKNGHTRNHKTQESSIL
jgi:2-oxoglutarate ferredoxin oxidoreductase subunit alpha